MKEANRKYHTGSKHCKIIIDGDGTHFKCFQCEHQAECREGRALAVACGKLNQVLRGLRK